MKILTENISPLNLSLDINNPRFIISPGGDESDAISYLLENEEIIELCKGINLNNGLLLGERIVVYKQDDKYIVAEGNRRTCACKLLLNPNLAPEKFRNLIPSIAKSTKNNINSIPIDIASSRDEAMSSMGSKHIAGIKKWASYAKMKYFFEQFNAGKSIDFISETTLSEKSKIITSIKQYKLLKYAENLSFFSDDEKNFLFDLSNKDIKISIFTKALTLKYTEGIFKGQSISSLLALNYDSETYEPITTINKYIFNKCIYLIAKSSLDPNIKFNTRSNIDELKELKQLLIEYKNNPSSFKDFEDNETTKKDTKNSPYTKNSKKTSLNKKLINHQNNNDSNNKGNNSNTENISKNNLNSQSLLNKDITEKNPIHPKSNTTNKKSKNILRPKNGKFKRPEPLKFFTNLTWSKVDPNISDNTGLLQICHEIVNISKNKDYKKYPISATILCRALLEQTLIYNLKNKNKFTKLVKKNNNRTPPLEKIINYYKSDLNNIFSDDNIKRCFNSFADGTGNKDYFDMVIHNPHLVTADSLILDSIAASGLFGFINGVLNES